MLSNALVMSDGEGTTTPLSNEPVLLFKSRKESVSQTMMRARLQRQKNYSLAYLDKVTGTKDVLLSCFLSYNQILAHIHVDSFGDSIPGLLKLGVLTGPLRMHPIHDTLHHRTLILTTIAIARKTAIAGFTSRVKRWIPGTGRWLLR